MAFGDENEVTERGACAGTAYELSVEDDDGGLELSYELQSTGPGEVWAVVVTQGNRTVLDGERTTEILDLLLRLRRAEADGLLPRADDEPEPLAPIEPEPANANEPAEAEAATAIPDEPEAEPEPNEPRDAQVDDLTAGRARLALYRVMLADDERTGAAYWERLTPEQRSTVHLAAEEEAAATRDPDGQPGATSPFASTNVSGTARSPSW